MFNKNKNTKNTVVGLSHNSLNIVREKRLGMYRNIGFGLIAFFMIGGSGMAYNRYVKSTDAYQQDLIARSDTEEKASDAAAKGAGGSTDKQGGEINLVKSNGGNPISDGTLTDDVDDSPTQEVKTATNTYTEPKATPVVGNETNSGTGTSSETEVEKPASLQPPVIPLGLNAKTDSANQITVGWSLAATATQYVLEYSTASSFSPLTTIKSGVNYSKVVGLSPSTTYYFRISAINAAGSSAKSAVVSAKTNAIAPVAPGVVSGFVASGSMVNGFGLKWSALAGTTDYSIRVSTTAGFENAAYYKPTSATNFTLSDLQSGQVYYLQIRASNNGAVGPWSATISGKTRYVTPATMTLVASRADTINASWSAVTRAGLYYLKYSENSDLSNAVTLSSTTTFRAVTGLKANTRYYFSVSAAGSAVQSTWRPALSQVTLRQFNIKIATYNIWTSNKDNHPITTTHPELKWSNRKTIAQKTVRDASMDIVGFQEMQLNQYSDMHALLPEYGSTANTDSGMRENTIFYKKTKYQLLAQNKFLLSAGWGQPGENPRGYDSYCVWAQFKDIQSGLIFYVFNNHLGTVYPSAPNAQQFLSAHLQGVNTLVSKVQTINNLRRPALVTGDYNIDTAEPGYLQQKITAIGYKKVRDITPPAAKINDVYNTFHGYQTPPKNGKHIDGIYMFSSTYSVSQRHQVIMTSINGVYPSDHFPVMANTQVEF